MSPQNNSEKAPGTVAVPGAGSGLKLPCWLGQRLGPALDHRFGWSRVPPAVSLMGDAFIALGFLFIFFVLQANPYGASTIQVTEDQKVISMGPYAHVRHPMYAGALLLIFGMPLALGSWWGLLVIILMVPALVRRLLDEEKFLKKEFVRIHRVRIPGALQTAAVCLVGPSDWTCADLILRRAWRTLLA